MRYPSWQKINELWLAPGIVIPAFANGCLWSVNVRTSREARSAAKRRNRSLSKYQALSGSRKNLLYGADDLKTAHTAVVCEGEFDALLLRQFLPAGWTAAALSSASMKASLRWAFMLGLADRILLAFDNDVAGDRARKHWLGEFPYAELLALPRECNDVTDYWRSGGDLATLVDAVR